MVHDVNTSAVSHLKDSSFCVLPHITSLALAQMSPLALLRVLCNDLMHRLSSSVYLAIKVHSSECPSKIRYGQIVPLIFGIIVAALLQRITPICYC